MKISFLSSAEIEQKLKRTQNFKKRSNLVRVLRKRWEHTARSLGEGSRLTDINFGMLP
jgi:hypothetical protein